MKLYELKKLFEGVEYVNITDNEWDIWDRIPLRNDEMMKKLEVTKIKEHNGITIELNFNKYYNENKKMFNDLFKVIYNDQTQKLYKEYLEIAKDDENEKIGLIEWLLYDCNALRYMLEYEKEENSI